jgi:hypothetical protein
MYNWCCVIGQRLLGPVKGRGGGTSWNRDKWQMWSKIGRVGVERLGVGLWEGHGLEAGEWEEVTGMQRWARSEEEDISGYTQHPHDVSIAGARSPACHHNHQISNTEEATELSCRGKRKMSVIEGPRPAL